MGKSLDLNGKIYTHDQIRDMILPAIKYLPFPFEGKCEQELKIDLGGLGEIVGYIDLIYRDQTPVIHDHKTTTNFAWAKTAQDLMRDEQSVIYGVYALEAFNADVVRCRWGYIRTSGKPAAHLVEIEHTPETLKEPWEGILADIKKMKGIRDSGKSALELEYCVDTCNKFGGCPYQKNCALSSAERMRGLKNMETLRERMLRMRNGGECTINPPEKTEALKKLEEPPVVVEATPEPVAEVVKVKKLKKVEPKPEAPTPAPAQDPKPPLRTIEQAQVGKRFDLYIDCIPNIPFIEFDTLIKPVLHDEKGTHYKLLQLYGGNGAWLSERLAEHLDKNDHIRGALVITLASPIARDVLEVLMSRAKLIVRGF
jgi:hypothetical protein